MPSSWIATLLDQEQVELTGSISPRPQDVRSLDDRSGDEVVQELGGRLLLRYLTESQVDEFAQGSSRGHWVTPTPISPEQAGYWLNLFAPRVRRRHALLLNPAQVAVIRGPAWIRAGEGIEYYLPEGFPKHAVLGIGPVQVR
jgi:hypothetical protein